jgi:hypothetical protein
MMPLQISGGNQRPHYPQISTLTIDPMNPKAGYGSDNPTVWTMTATVAVLSTIGLAFLVGVGCDLKPRRPTSDIVRFVIWIGIGLLIAAGGMLAFWLA